MDSASSTVYFTIEHIRIHYFADKHTECQIFFVWMCKEFKKKCFKSDEEILQRSLHFN